MNDFDGLLATDFGLKPQEKSAPIAASKGSSNLSASSLNFDLGSLSDSRSNRTSSSFRHDLDSHFLSRGSSNQKNQDFGGLDDLLGGSARYAGKSNDPRVVYDDVKLDNNSGAESSNSPVYDKPMYDDDIFDGMPGLQSSTKHNYDDVFSSMSSPQKGNAAAFDDLLPGFGKAEPMSTSSSGKSLDKNDQNIPAFDDLMKGFGSSSRGERSTSGAPWSSEPTRSKATSKLVDEPFNISGQYTDPLEEINKIGSSRSTKFDSIPASNGKILHDLDPFAGLGKSIPTFSSNESNTVKRSSNPLWGDVNMNETGTNTNKEANEKETTKSPQHHLHKEVSDASNRQFNETLFDMPTVSTNSSKFFHQSASPPSYDSTRSKDTDMPGDMTPKYEKYADNFELSNDMWLSVSDIPLFTQPTHAPPPSRPPPTVPAKITKSGMGSSTATTARKKVNDYSSSPNFLPYSHVTRSPPEAEASGVSPIDELEDFARGRSRNNVDENTNGLYGEELEMNSAAAAMKEAMDRAEAKFRHAKEVRERESIKVTRSKEPVYPDQDERTMQDERTQKQERERDREREEKKREQRRLESERDRTREREEREREQRRLEREKERAREIEREKEKARQAVERATREARERAAHEARTRAERAAVDKANAEARQRAERAAVQRAQAEARERAVADAREKLERAAAEARERENTEAKERETREKAFAARAEAEARARAERSAVERATAEARERAAAEARERATASARWKPQKNDDDLESFFNASGRASSVPRPRANPSDPLFDTLSKNRPEPEVARKSSGSSSSMRKASSSSNVIDDLSSIFGAAPSSGGLQEVEGESEERRRARMERHQRTEERAAKALAEKNQRDLQLLKDQAERHRIAETLDVEIKRWAAGKEGNLRALLSTLQYVIWPECGWQPVSLTDMITAANVKKVYRKATLCIHPDKVQQKGANLQQKYIAEKVFDILKEAWNKFNSEELF